MTKHTCPVMEAYGSKTTAMRFKGTEITLTLSHGLFSSYDVDSGTRLLLRVISNHIDKLKSASLSMPHRVLDAGSGTGVIGIALGSYFQKEGHENFVIRAQDRDELARQFTACNGLANGLGSGLVDTITGDQTVSQAGSLREPRFSTHTEPLLSAPGPYDWIVSNIPAKAGLPVLEYFVRRSLALLEEAGRVFVVIVDPLAETFKGWILKYGAELVEETAGPEHRVFVYGKPPAQQDAEKVAAKESFSWEAYKRILGTYQIKDTEYTLQSLHGVEDFDQPHYIHELMAALILKLQHQIRSFLTRREHLPILFFEVGQGHFPLWFVISFLQELAQISFTPVIGGRNILSLTATKQNLENLKGSYSVNHTDQAIRDLSPAIVPSVDPDLSAEELLKASGGPFPLMFLFPDPVPKTAPWPAYWTGLEKLADPGSLIFIGLSATEAERFDRQKRKGFQRIGELKRQGWKVLAYQKAV
ncbi:methyltransferase [Gracilinema caldarium]|uniref:methyltransferase n=1 Tax=Gracilinema caldarium TaxID=215591 RepID=UPI0026EC8FF3|nr:methyltransferase [Gracilinema caldarium]